MKFRKPPAFFLVLCLIMLLTGATLLTLYLMAAEPPIEAIDRCNRMLSKSRNAEAETYARDLQSEADEAMKKAMLEWKSQNARWVISRDYTILHELLQMALKKAERAYQQSIIVKDSMHHDLAIELAKVEKSLRLYADSFGFLPVNQQSRRDYQTAEMMYFEAREAYEKGNYHRVGSRLEKSHALIASSIKKSEKNLGAYFASLPIWKQWADETIEWSRINKKPAIVIDKFARKCYLYKDGKKVRTFNAEFGINWVGEKRYKGDKATPEGKYLITSMKTGRHTKFYKALLINYPNAEDKKRFANEINRGMISKKAVIGGLIEIHGGGGKGINWTDGCVALANEDIDILFHQVSAGTPVTIIGSLKNINELDQYRKNATASL